MSFLTGSQVYGKPRGNSDIDLCVLMTKEEMVLLGRFADRPHPTTQDSDVGSVIREQARAAGHTFAERDSISYRFGKLNLLVTCNPKMFDAWSKATLELSLEADMTGAVKRDRAVEVFTKHEREVLA